MSLLERLRQEYSIYRMNKRVRTYDLKKIPVFSHIEIETINRCNGKCSFCPVNANAPQREYVKMEEELFESIIKQLKDIDYSGELCFSSNNEPFLDPRISEFVKYARTRLPKAYLMMWTNGSIMTWDRFESVISCLDRMFIDIYGIDGVITSDENRILKMFEEHNYHDYNLYEGINGFDDEKKVVMMRRDVNEVLSSRGGQAPNKKFPSKTVRKKCIQMFTMFIIRPDGKISLCCCDALGKYTMGDLKESSLMEIWNDSEEYMRVRSEMQKNGRKNLELCKNCDFEA